MSGSYENTTGSSDLYNEGAAHDSALYDPSLHDNQIVAVFEDRTAAQRAAEALVQAGIARSAVSVVDRTEGDAASGVSTAEDRNQEGFWGAVKSLFAPDDEVHAYDHAIKHGHAMVVVVPTAEMDRHRVIEVLEAQNPIDFDAKLAEWRQQGYDYSGAARSTNAGYASSATTDAVPLAGGMAAGTAASAVDTGAMVTPAAMSPQPMGARTPAEFNARDEGTIDVVKERLRVGKREVAQGAVRVRSYVVERPVEEQVTLRQETVHVDRRPVDRPIGPGADPFQEQSIVARATAEEAVIAKEARVVEEIGLSKEATERTETVRDTVRETEVVVENEADSAMGTGGTTTNATPGATSSGMNSPRK